MKNIKKFLSIFLIGIMMISCLTGCGGAKEEEVDVNDPFYRIENEELVKISNNRPEIATSFLMIEKLEALVEKQVEAIKNIK